ncbi:mucin-5B-like [Haemorhous mexicanus]|uniref:mucin-5B-like n=1 Tax=Haemorhous mexicanus TaxID=30427 RepID=UPI0028BEA028|nr:mucin-5B-like [Haemorhous mexicanus]
MDNSEEKHAANPAHNGRVCSTWGNFHFKTFDGDIFTFPGLCNYVFASHCNAAYEDFNIQIRREVVANTPTISHITMKLEGVVAELTKDAVIVDGNGVQLPYSQSGITIEKSSIYVKVGSKVGVVLLWNEKDSILLELNEKYANQTCGLCGDFNGFPIYNEFISNNIQMTALQFGNLQKMDGPTEHCEDATSLPTYNCSDLDDICEKTLTSSAFADCNDLVDVKDYIKACQDDLCRSEESENSSCICDTFAEYSRQCAHAGGQPLDWRTSKLCPKTCPYNMQYQECNSPCTDTCTNPERSLFCEEHCIDGCFCPPGTVFDDINNSGCIPQQECSCIYNSRTYATGASFSEPCQTCTCNGGQWSCQDKSCPGTCSVVGGSHISTYDKKQYDHHGDCTYVLSKDCKDEKFTILAELRKCGLTDTETCLKSVTLNMNKGQTIVEVKPDGGVFVNSIYTQLPMSAANVTMFRPSSFFMIMDTSFGVQVEVQFTPVMQVFVRLDASFKNQTCGLCGNFNNIQTDDFEVISGIIEGTASAFANTWKTQASCPNIQQSFENPCALSIDNEKYAQHWCGLLTNSTGPFAACHYAVNPAVYHTNCMFDTCNCENSEDCLCAALSAYVRACAAKGIQLQGWRTDVCTKYTTSCPKSLSYSYTISSCQPTCRSLSEPDVTCNIKFIPVDGCTCVNGTYMDDSGKCVPANECPCYYKGSPIQFGEVVHENGRVCTCVEGRLNCIGASNPTSVCESPMVYFDCENNTAGTPGAECQKSCQTLDMQCYSSQCTSGCICPDGLVLDGNGGCIPEEECPCIHNEAMYQPGEKISFDCNTCVCKNRKWECTKDQCLGTCAVYGDGHYNTFDDKSFSFNGNCEYTLVQDHCGKSGTVNGTFSVATENVPCGNTGTTCSKSIKVFLESYELILSEERVSVIKRGQDDEVPYTVRSMGMYLVIETKSGLILMWDKKTSIFIKLSPGFKGQVCGLCGNYDGNSVNDFTTRSQSVVENVLEFGNSWKVSSTCPDAASVKDPCSTNPYRKSWSEKQCSIINSNVFAACHSQVEPAKYYQACVTDACACDTGGDCDCFCTAVAAYAQACSEVGVCIAWRSPTICPLFCDYYNQQGECEWHYKPCGASCMKTCKNPSGKCLNDLSGLEGCYPNCPPDKPYFNEDQMKCVSLCDCYDDEDGKIYKRDECNICECTSEGLHCKFDDKACNCIYEGNSYKYGELIYNTTDGTGWCISATCDVNGTISRSIFKCGIFTTTPFTFSTSQPTTTASEMTTATPVTTVCVKNVCVWSEWYDSTQPENKEDSGDYETYQNLKDKGYSVCTNPSDVQCRAKEYPYTEITNLNQTIECSQSRGLICNNKDQESKQCYNYEIRMSCCRYIPCSEAQTTTPTTTTEFTTTALESTPFTVQTTKIPTTQNQERTTQSKTSVTATSQVSTTGYQFITSTAGTSTVVTQAPSSPNTISTLPESTLQTTSGTTIISSTTALPTQGTTVTTPGPRVTTQGTTSTASTSTTTREISTTSTEGTLPTALSTVAIQTTSTITASTAETIKTTSGTTSGPSTTGSAGQETTTIATTTSTSPTQTEGTTTTTPPTTTVPTTAATTIRISNSTDNCVVESCAWTVWFNVDSPSAGSENGDLETFENIRAAGYEFCEKPQDIKCRAKDYPDTVVETMEQKFDCSLDRGLVCRNKDQTLKYPMCFDYEVSVLCCDRKQCQTTVPTPATTVSTSTIHFPAETTTVAKQPAATPTAVPTLPQRETTTTVGTTSTLSTQGTTIISPRYTEPVKITTTIGTTAVPSTTASVRESTTIISSTTSTSPPQTEGTTTIIPTTTTRVPTSATSTASTSRTTAASTTTTSAPGETSTVATQAPTSPTTPSEIKITTTTGTTARPSTMGSTRGETTIITTTTSTSPPQTEGTTTIIPATTTRVPTSATSTASTSRTTERSTTRTSATSAPGETSTVATQAPTSPTTPSEIKITTTTGTTSGPSTTGSAGQETTIIATTTSTSPPQTEGTTTTTPPTTTEPTTAATTIRISNSTDNCVVESCAWTVWFNVDSPSAGSENGDLETFENIRAAGYEFCEKPQDIKCRAKDYPDTVVETMEQKFDCSLDRGLVCRNKDQTLKYPMCFDYEVSVLCCDRKQCQTTVPTPATTVSTSTIHFPAETRTVATQPAATPTAVPTLPQRATTTTVGTTSTLSTQGTTIVSPRYTEPVKIKTTIATTAVPSTTASVRESTTIISSTTSTSPPQTEGTTTIIPTTTTRVPTSATSTASTSSTTKRSTTRTSATSAPGETSTVATQAPTSPTTPSEIKITTTTGTTARPSTMGSTRGETTIIATTTSTSPPQTEGTTTIIPTTRVPTSATSTASTSRTTERSTTRTSATSAPGETSTVATQTPTSPTTPSEIKITTTTGTTSGPSTTGSAGQETTITATTTSTSPPQTEGTTTTTPPTTTVPTTAATTIRISNSTDNCVVESCAWTVWFNVDSPSAGSENGDLETFENIRAAGYEFCEKPQDIKCRAKDYPDTVVETMEQKFDCSLDRGLVCRNKDQTLKYPMCFDYEVSVLCCDRKQCQTTVPTPATTVSTSTIHFPAETRTVATQPAATPTAEPTLPQRATTTTVGTTSTLSTQGTTIVSPRYTEPVKITTTIGTTAVPSTTASVRESTTIISTSTSTSPPKTEGTTTIIPTTTTRVPTAATSTASTSRTTERSTTRTSATSAPGETSTVATQAPTSPTTPSEIKITTTTGTTARPSTMGSTRGETTIIATTTSTSPPQTEGTTTTTPPTTTVPTSATSTASTSRTTAASTTTTSAPGETSTVATQAPTSPTTPSEIKITTTTGTTARPSTMGSTRGETTIITTTTSTSPPQTEGTTTIIPTTRVPTSATSTASTSRTTERSTTRTSATSAPGETSTVATQAPTSPTTPSEIKITTTTGTTARPSTMGSTRGETTIITTTTSTSPPQTEGTTTIIPTTRVPTSATSTASTSRTTERSTTRTSATSAPGETSTVATQTPTSPTTPSEIKITTTTGTTSGPSTTGSAGQETTTIATTTSTSPPQTEGTTTTTPPTTTVPTTAATTIRISNSTDNCVVESCAWTVWFNVDSPSAGSENGDLETFENIRAAGYEFCEKPQDIKCRAKDYPDTVVETMEQKFDCSLDRGLVCRNKDQILRYPMCFDYEVSVLCCDRKQCQTTVPTPATTVSTSTIHFPAETRTVATQPAATPTAVPTLPQRATTTTVGTTSTLSTQGTTIVSPRYTEPVKITTTIGTTAVPSTTASVRESTTIISSTTSTSPPQTEGTTTIIPTTTRVPTPTTSTASTSRTTERSTTRTSATSAPGEISTVATQAPTSPTTPSEIKITTTTGTTARPSTMGSTRGETTIIATTTSTSPPQTEGTTTTTPPTTTVPTSATSTASTSRTTAASTTTTSAPGETSTVATQAPTSPTTPSEIKITTTTGTTARPSTMGSTRGETTIITTTTSTSPPQTEGTTTIIPATTTRVPTSATSTASTSRTTERSTTRTSATSAPGETSTVATQAPTSPTTPSEIKITTTTGTTSGPSTTGSAGQETTIIATTTSTSPPQTEGTTTTTPPTTTVPTTAATTIRISNSTDNCVVESCAWTVWFNVDSPSAGSENGDLETFENIRAAGYEFCEKPQDIKCRAKDYPDTVVETMEQKFDCSLDRGLVCRNKDQILKYPMCFDYEVSVLCCDRKQCQTTVPTPATTVSTSTIHFPAETRTVATQPAATPTAVPTLPQRATTTTVGTTSTLSTQGTTIISPRYTEPVKITTTIGTTAVPSTTASVRESTTIISSTTSTSPSQTEGTTTIIPTTTTRVPTPATGTASTSTTTREISTISTEKTLPTVLPSVVIQTTSTITASTDKIKLGTTAGTTFGPSTMGSTRGETTIITTTASTSPPQTEGTTTIILPTTTVPTSATSTASTSRTTAASTTTTSAPGETSTVATQAPTSPTTPSEVKITTTTGTTAHPSTTGSAGQETTIITTTISPASTSPEITLITTSGPSAVLTTTLPQSGSTTVASTGTSQSSHVTTSTPATFSSSTSTSVTSSKIPPCFCHVFETLFSPGEVVYNRTDRAGCNFYALCSKECEIEPFHGPCPVTTPAPSVASSTTSQAASPTTATTTTTSVERNCTDVNPARKPGEEWVDECQKCVCDSLTATVQCQPLPCQTAQQTTCDLGFVSMAVLPQKDPCCPAFKCQPIPDVCVINETLYTVGKSVVINSCKKCTCSSEKDPETNANIMHCETVECETSCPLGYQYMTAEGECCGKCIEVACKVKLSNGTIHVLYVNEILPLDQCSHYKCEKVEDQFVAVQTKRVCPEHDPEECDPDETEFTSDGCCKICKPKSCKVHTKETVIRHADCESSESVELSYCDGTCPGSSMYSFEANQMEHNCGCCQELGTQTREVTLTCQNGTSINYTYLYVETCQCVNACSSETTAAPDSQFQQSRKYGSQMQQAVSLGSQWQLS